jgi:hypothetical protein
MYKYENNTLTIGEASYTGITAEQVEKTWDAVCGMVKDDAARDELMKKFVAMSAKLIKGQEVKQVNADHAALQAETTKRAAKLAEKRAAWVKEFDAKTSATRTKYGIETLKPAPGENADGTLKFTANLQTFKFAELAHDCYGVRSVRCEDGQTVEGSFDDPKLAELASGAKQFNLDLVGLANAANESLGNKVKEIAVHFGDDGTIVWKGQSGAGGSSAGRVIAKGYKVGDQTFDKAEDACKALGIEPKSHAPNGTPYWAAALKPAIDAGRCTKVTG